MQALLIKEVKQLDVYGTVLVAVLDTRGVVVLFMGNKESVMLQPGDAIVVDGGEILSDGSQLTRINPKIIGIVLG